MNSALYVGPISHVRKVVKPYRFTHTLPWWLLDLDELDELEKFMGFKRGNFSLFSFRDHDHINLGHETAKENAIAWARTQGVNEEIQKIWLLTNLRTWGYVFNPVSFYYLQGTTQRWIIVEIGNTFWEQKPTLLGPFTGDQYEQSIEKLFYISPFLPLDNTLDLKLTWPSEKLSILIDDKSPKGESELTAVFSGQRVPLTELVILKTALKFPFLCLGVMAMIHWHALKLWLMGIPFIRKNDRLDLQQGVFQWKSRKFVKT